MAEDDFMRALDPGERFIWLLDCMSCTNFLVMAELSGHPLSEETLRRGLDELQASQPMLSARVVEAANGTVAFRREAGLRIPLLIEDRGEGDWQLPIEAEFNVDFAEASIAPARCHLLRLPDRSVVSINFLHAISDARSGVTVLKDLLRFCLRGEAIPAVQGIPSPMHALYPGPFQWREHPGKAEALAKEIMTEFVRHGPAAELPFLTHEEPRREPRLRQVRMDPTHGRSLQERCRVEGTTVHGAVSAAHLIATRGLFDDDAARTLYLMCPVDMRPHVASGLDGWLSYCTSLLRSNYRVEGPEAFWPLAREISGDLKRRIQRGDGHLTYAVMPLDKIGGSGPAFEAFSADVERLPAGSNVSNIGRVEPMHDCPDVTSISFALCGLPKHMASLNVSSYNDQLIINMTFDAAKLAPELVDRLTGDLEQLLGQAADARASV